MTVLEPSGLESGTVLDRDLVVVGSGPAGLTVARRFAGTGVRVLVLESGGRRPDRDADALNEVDNVGARRIEDQSVMRSRILGGASFLWTGRCTAFDDIDFAARPWVPASGWPLRPADLTGSLEAARGVLGLGPNDYDDRLWRRLGMPAPTPQLDPDLLLPRFWQASQSPHDPSSPVRFGRNDIDPPGAGIELLLHATVTQVEVDEAGTAVTAVQVTLPDLRTLLVRAGTIVLACGGIENARLLLASRDRFPAGLGNGHDLVGRYLMDHPGSVIGSFDPRHSDDVRSRFGRYRLGQAQYLHGLVLSPQVQEREELLNAAVFLEEYPAVDDPWHAGQRLAGRVRHRGRPVTADTDLPAFDQAAFWRAINDDEPPEPTAAQDVASLLRHPRTIAGGLLRMTREHRPPLFRARRVDLYSLIEQRPDPDSRITLSEKRDAFGMPLSRIDWRLHDQERHTLSRLAELVSDQFGRAGLSRPRIASWLGRDDWRDNLTDRAHPTGSTRMSSDPKSGVVDPDGQVHGIHGLYVTGSSVFPTAGHGNPTLMIVAMALRLGDHLRATRLR
ncbi:MAG: GMC family oxidoreductase [Actinomycetota bacterium]|nr:MAG: GMC family oxidoreductase [Actinomycetota bacterium]